MAPFAGKALNEPEQRLIGPQTSSRSAVPRPQNDARYAPADGHAGLVGRGSRGRSLHVNMDALKRQAAARALEHVRDGMKLGLGTGSTAKHFVELLGERVRAGLNVVGVPTSEATRIDAMRCGIPLTTLDDIDRLDLTVDGADEIDPALNVIKGGGGALLREKIVASGLGSHDRDRRRHQMGRSSRPFSAADRSDSVRPGGDATRHGRRICGRRRFRANGGPKGQGRPRFCHRWRPLDCRCPSRTHCRCAASGAVC